MLDRSRARYIENLAGQRAETAQSPGPSPLPLAKEVAVSATGEGLPRISEERSFPLWLLEPALPPLPGLQPLQPDLSPKKGGEVT